MIGELRVNIALTFIKITYSVFRARIRTRNPSPYSYERDFWFSQPKQRISYHNWLLILVLGISFGHNLEQVVKSSLVTCFSSGRKLSQC